MVRYDDVTSLPASTPTVFVDMAGDGAVVRGIHEHFGDALKYSCVVGGTHWDQIAMGQTLPGVQPVMFFAPDQAAKRTKDWGAAGLQQRIGQAWLAFVEPASTWIRVVHSRGATALERVYHDVLTGRARPDEGQVVLP